MDVGSRSPTSLALRRLRRDRETVVFGALLLALLVVFLAAPLYAELAGTSPSENHLTDTVAVDGEERYVVSLEGLPIGPTWTRHYLLGADENGRDLMVRVLYGGRTSLLIGVAAVAITLVGGAVLALLAGYFRGRTDTVISRLLDLIWSFPALLLGLLFASAINLNGVDFGPLHLPAGSKLIPVLVIGCVYVPFAARPLRGQVLTLREQSFVEAARASGAGTLRLMLGEILPHLWSTILVLGPLLFANAIVLESALSFLGAGVPRPSRPSAC